MFVICMWVLLCVVSLIAGTVVGIMLTSLRYQEIINGEPMQFEDKRPALYPPKCVAGDKLPEGFEYEDYR